MITILIIILILLAIGAFPMGAGYNANWGYGPSGIVGIILIVLLVWLLLGHRI